MEEVRMAICNYCGHKFELKGKERAPRVCVVCDNGNPKSYALSG